MSPYFEDADDPCHDEARFELCRMYGVRPYCRVEELEERIAP